MRAWFSGGVIDGLEYDVPAGTADIRVTLDAIGTAGGAVTQIIEKYVLDPHTDGGFRVTK